MNIVNDVFKKSIINYDKLIKYGFIIKDKYYYFERVFYNNTFKAIIIIDKNGNVSGKVIDIEMNEEYTNINRDTDDGFVSSIRSLYKEILIDIRDNCCSESYFICDQSNRLAELIKSKYNIKPEFLFDDSPDCGVFRNKSSNKWFGIIMNIKRSKLDNGSGNVDVINIKLDPDEIVDLLHKKGFYKAYHMNKKSWISIVLDNTLDDNNIFELICKSYDNVSKKVKK